MGHKGPNPGKGDGVEDNHRRHRHQRQLGAAVHRQRARQLNGRDFIVHPRNRAAENNAQENAHIHHHKAQQLGLPGAIIFTVNFFGESMGVFQPEWLAPRNIIKHITETSATSVFLSFAVP